MTVLSARIITLMRAGSAAVGVVEAKEMLLFQTGNVA